MLQDDILHRFQDIANIFIIYIEEAHAADECPIGESAGVINYKHKTLLDRIQCAKKFKDRYNYKIPIYTDNMDNSFQETFNCWPFRCIITEQKKIKYISVPDRAEYDFMEIYQYFEANKK